MRAATRTSRAGHRQTEKKNRLLFSQTGQSMVEMLVILPVMLLIIFATIQMALVYHAKTTLNYAAFEAVRAGTINCDKQYQEYNVRCESEVGQYAAVKEGFARGLAPLYSYYDPDGNTPADMEHPASNQVDAFQQARDRVLKEFDTRSELIRIERLNPTKKAFADFAVDGVIPNDNLMYRTSSDGGGSRMSIQDANLLHLRITYWYPLYVPFVNKLMFNTFICCKAVGGQSLCKWASDPVCEGDEPRIPITATAVMRMQTPVENSAGWSESALGR